VTARSHAAMQAVARFLRPRLQRRIVGLFLGMLLLVQAASFLAIRQGIEGNARRDVAQGMASSEALLRRLLAQNGQQLSEAARLLAADYGFRSAVAAGDRETLKDALANQAERIGASIAVFTDERRRPIAATVPDAQRVMALLAADASVAAQARSSSALVAASLLVEGERPFQMVTVPVNAPALIGHVSMGFPLNAAIDRDFADLTQAQVVFAAREVGGRWRILQPRDRPLAEGVRDRLVDALSAGAVGDTVDVAGDLTALHRARLSSTGETQLDALVLRSIDEAIAPYRRLQLTLLAITLAGVAVFAVGSVVTARRIAGPINALAASARRLADGDYTSPVPVAGSNEVGHLARSFEAMRVGIRERDAEIRRLAYWDSLTGLPNRARFRDVLGERIAEARASGEPCSAMHLDIDRFKHVNDVLGPSFGDRLLEQIARRLEASVRSDRDTVARLAGDKFSICLPRTGAAAAVDLAQRMRLALVRPFVIDGHTVDVTAGVGIASFPAQAGDADMLMGRAEIAMHAAKARQSGVVVYDPALDSASEASLSLLGELRTAIDQDQLRLYLQPKFALASGDAAGAEALVRWQHPRRGLLGPADFVPFAEQTGFIRELTAWMVDRAAQRASLLRDQGFRLKVAVNLSTKDLMDARLADRLEASLSAKRLDAQSLSLEITESAIMDDPERALGTLRRLDRMGLGLSIDDFGTGYSSLAYLKKLPISELKIDRSFVMGMEQDRADLKIVRSTVELAHNLGYTVVAEGVESAQTWAILRALKCDQAQGYYMARPMPEEDFGHWLGHWSRPQARLSTEFSELLG
jgi:diguanylate cyclase (GGDEF)-like protein